MSAETVAAPEGVRVALLSPSLRGGGLECLVRDLALLLRRRGYAPAVFCLDGLGVHAAALRSAGIPVTDCTEPRVRVRGVPLRLIRELRRFRPRLIHAHGTTWYPAVVAKSALRYPRLVFTDHGRYPPEPALRARVEGWCRRRTDAMVAVSGPLAEYLRDYLRLAEPPPVIPNGVDLERYGARDDAARLALRAAWGIAPDETLALCVGRFAPVKNHSVLLEALSAASARAPRLRLALLGTGPLEAELRRKAAELGLGERVLFLGFREDVADCLRAADAFVLPSSTEGLPVSLLEAMAAGLPVVASAVGGIPDALGDPPAGLLVPPSRVPPLAEALARIAGEPALREALGARARAASVRFSLRAFEDGYLALYSSLLEASPC